jgi:hypothetical protein
MSHDVCMSEYGRLWEEVSNIRREIRDLVPGATTNTLAEARASVEAMGKAAEVGHLLEEWQRYEWKMARIDDA